LNRTVYFCNHCKKALHDIEELLFVEEGSPRGFCGEKCIEQYYAPIVAWYENRERETRSLLDIANEDCKTMISDANVMDKALSRPDEIWRWQNEIGEDLFVFIKNFAIERPFYAVIMCHLFERQPSFILLASATRSEEFINQFRSGERIVDPDEFISRDDLPAGAIDLEVEQEALSAIEAKKSAFLARLLQDRTAADIPFEQFDLYEKYFKTTLEDPDEIYTDEDDDGDQLFTYIKAYQHNNISFYYFIICVEFEKESDGEAETRKIIPLMAFPTLDGELYHLYRGGKLVSGSLKN
tara:strand:+ start:27 stop:914 length:888 start_codon:yes stop_codon:yes gene_type:complete